MNEQKYYDIEIDVTRCATFHVLASNENEARAKALSKARDYEMPFGSYVVNTEIVDAYVSDCQEE